MINTLKLKARMVEKGFTVQSLSKKVGLNSHSLGRQMRNCGELRRNVIQKIKKELDIADSEFCGYFFFEESHKCNGSNSEFNNMTADAKEDA